MFRPRHSGFRTMQALAIFAMCLRVLVPSGYMPASVSDGWYLQWCPDGVATEVLDVLFGGAEGASLHAHHGAPTQADEQAETASFAQCDLSAFSADAHSPAPAPSVLPAAPAALAAVVPPTAAYPARVIPYRSRAPPNVPA